MRTISQRQLRNDNAQIMRAVEDGESFIVTRNGAAVAVVKPASEAEIAGGLRLGQAARRSVDWQAWPRVVSSVASEDILNDLRGE